MLKLYKVYSFLMAYKVRAVFYLLFFILFPLKFNSLLAQDGILVFTKTNDFRHQSIEAGVTLFNEIGTKYNMPVTATEDATVFNATTLSDYSVIVFCNTSGNNLLDADQQAAMEAFIQSGKGFVGVHAATDTYRDGSWSWYNDLVGGIVQGSPNNHTDNNFAGTIDIVDTENAITAHLDNPWEKSEEYYYWELDGGYLFNGNENLLTVRSTGPETYDVERPITWYKIFDGGKSFYTALGHNATDYSSDEQFKKLLENAVLWASNRLESQEITFSIQSPVEGSTYNESQTIPISIESSVPNDSLQSVNYYVNDTLLAEVTTGELLSFDWANPVPASYNVFAEITHNNDSLYYSDTVSITVEPLVTSLTITSPEANSIFSEADDIIIGLTAEVGDFVIDSIVYIVDDTSRLATLSGENALSYTWQQPTAGDYALHASMWLNNGDTVYSDTINLTVEPFIASLSITSPANNAVFSEAEDIEINLNVEIGVFTIDSVVYIVNDITRLEGLSGDEVLNYTWEQPTAGDYALHASMWLNNGDTIYSDTINLTVESFIPSLSITFPTDNAVFSEADDIEIILAADSGRFGIDSVAYILNDTDSLALLEGEDKLEYLWVMPDTGVYTLHSTMWLDNGDTVYSDTINLNVQPFLPSLSITSPTDNAVFTEADDIQIILAADSGRFGIDSIAYVLNDTDSLAVLEGEDKLEYLWIMPDTGTYTLHSSMWLDNGDSIFSDTINLTVEPFMPSLSITSPTDNAIFTEADDIQIVLAADSGRFGIDSIVYVLNDTDSLAVLEGEDKLEYLWVMPDTGTYTLHSSMWLDNGDSVFSDTINLSVIPFEPSLVFITPSDSTIFNDNEDIDITLLADAGRDTISRIEYYADSTTIGVVDISPFDAFTWANPDTGQYFLSAIMFLTNGDSILSDTIYTSIIPFSTEVAITSPTSGSTFDAPTEILIRTSISIPEEQIESVEFFQGDILIGFDSLSPYQYSWTNVPAGEYDLKIEVILNDGGRIVSGDVPVSVVSPGNFKRFRLEAEDFILSNYQIESGSFASEGRLIGILTGEAGTVGEAKIAFEGITDSYSISVGYYDESDGVSEARFLLNDTELATWLFDDETGETVANSNSFRKITFDEGATLNNGDTIRLLGTRTAFALARFDYVEIQSLTTINILPEVAITSPSANSSFENGADIIVSADATDEDGQITRVEFYQNSQLLAVDAEQPYTFNWSNVQAGNYTITAIAYDESGGQTSSEGIAISVDQPSGECTTLYEEKDGLLIMEAESAENTTNWRESTIINGYTGTSYVLWNGSDFFDEPGSEILTYDFRINDPGVYRFVWRSYNTIGNVASENNDSWLRAQGVRMFAVDDGNEVYPVGGFGLPADAATVPGSVEGWFKVYMNELDTWSYQTNTFDDNPHEIFMEFASSGNYTIEIAGRSTGHAIDRLILFKDPVTFTNATDINVDETFCDGVIINEKPNVRITAPQNSSFFPSGATINITADAFDTDGIVTNLAFFEGNNLLGELTEAPYSFTWADVADGTYFLTAVATDDGGETVTSSAVTISVGDNIQNQPPSGNIISPVDGSRFDIGTSFTIQSLATDDDGSINRVEFYYNDQLLNIDETAPYRFDWETTIAGRYDISARIVDNLEEVTLTDTISIFINAIPGNLPPVVSITAPQDNAFFPAGEAVTITANASDPDGSIRSVEFFLGGIRVGVDDTAPYATTVTNPTEGASSVFVRAIDNQGATSNSNLISVIVGEDVSENPALVITSPVNDTTIATNGSVTVRVATDPELTINTVSFFLDSEKLVDDTNPPFSFTLSFPFEGIYKLRVRAFDDLGNTYVSKELTITVGNGGPTALEKLAPEQIAYGIAPNPTEDLLSVYHQLPVNTHYKLVVTDLMGRYLFENKIVQKSVGEHRETINVSKFPRGIYLVYLKTENAVYVRKMRKN